jgi:hypothetical protein
MALKIRVQRGGFDLQKSGHHDFQCYFFSFAMHFISISESIAKA